jgi:hypothetical protein
MRKRKRSIYIILQIGEKQKNLAEISFVLCIGFVLGDRFSQRNGKIIAANISVKLKAESVFNAFKKSYSGNLLVDGIDDVTKLIYVVMFIQLLN